MIARASPRPPARRRKEVRPQQLLDAALELFVEKGFAATRIEEVARHAGASKGTLYLYYPSKEELFKAVVRQNMGKLIGEAGAVAAGAGGRSCTELLRELLTGWWARVGHSQVGGLHKVMLAEVRNFPELAQFYADEVITPARELFQDLIRRGIERGEFRRVDVRAATVAVMSPLIFLMLHRHSFGACAVQGFDVDTDATLAAHLDLVLTGLQGEVEARR
ncbi:MAG: TetR/AcrR family transcriptional regulator [Rubrivivax sp.]|jgi:AcrR family transcriptional regulator|nr:TetR/AcrR family transcriptional regulator [Rubrivivax sp.]